MPFSHGALYHIMVGIPIPSCTIARSKNIEVQFCREEMLLCCDQVGPLLDNQKQTSKVQIISKRKRSSFVIVDGDIAVSNIIMDLLLLMMRT
jgi:hypothetical protein